MDIQKQRNIQLAMGILVMLCTGSIYAWSVFVPSLQEAFGWNASQTSLVFTFTILFLNIGSFLGGNLVRRLGVRTVIAAGLAIVGNATPLATEVGASSGLAVLLASAISLANGLGRIMFGAIYDRMGRRFTLVFDAAVFLGAIVLLYLAGLMHSVPVMAVSFMVLGLSYGGIASCNAAYILGTFGPANYASNFGAFNLANMFASPISQVIGGSMAVRLGSYTATFPILVGVAGVGLALSLLLKEHVDAPR